MHIQLPNVISGTSLLGNLYKEIPYEDKKAIVKAYIDEVEGIPMFDSAGKYGAGLALEVLGRCLADLNIQPDRVFISNKLAWVRKPLRTPEPTFEKGIWHNLSHDAEQKISYEGILQCFENGNELLGAYQTQFASVHDPDEYLAQAIDESDYRKRYEDIMEAYRALLELKSRGIIKAVGIGAKDWRSIELISRDVTLDWVMIANSYTIYQHPPELIRFIATLHGQGITVINSAVFHGGFLTGGNFFNYVALDPQKPADQPFFQWRERYYGICREFGLDPAAPAIYFGRHVPGVKSIALNSSHPSRVSKNMAMANTPIPESFWQRLKNEALIAPDYPYL
ncbi:aldo/keto reductase [Niabella terrae]